MGIENPSAKYLSGYLENNDEIPDISIHTVLKSVGIIELMLHTSIKPKKELVIETNGSKQMTIFDY